MTAAATAELLPYQRAEAAERAFGGALPGETTRETRERRRIHEAAVREGFKRDLEAFQFGDRQPSATKLAKLFEIAWDYGHSNGYHEVEGHYNELAPLVEPE